MRHAIDSSNFLSLRDHKLESFDSHASDEFSLREILPTASFFCGSDVTFESVAQSSKDAVAGDLVVYRIGEDAPERVIADAMARGASGILTEQILPSPLPQCVVGDVELAMDQIVAATLSHPDRKLLTIGVVGPAGKTTTALLVASLLRSAGVRTAYQTDLGASDGVVQEASQHPTLCGADLVAFLSEAGDSQCAAAVVEVTDNDLTRGRFDAIQFDLLIVTGSHSSADDFGPSGLQCALEQMTPKGVVIAPADCPKAVQVVRDSGVRMVTYGVRTAADLTAKIIDQTDGMTTLLITHHDTTAVMETTLCGAAMAANHAAAAMAGLLVDQSLTKIVETLSQLRVIPGRGQRLDSIDHATVVIDAGGSPDRVRGMLRSARSMKGSGRLWCVLAMDGREDNHHLTEYGTALEKFATDTVITSVPGTQDTFLAASHAVLDGVQKCAAMRLVANQERAIRWVLGEAKPLDTVLILGGINGTSAHQQRSQVKQLTDWVECERAAAESPQLQPNSAAEKPVLKLYK